MIDFLLKFGSAVLELNRLLNTRFIPDHPSSSSPVGLSLAGILRHHNDTNYSYRDYELQKIYFLIQDLQLLEKNRPDLLKHYRREVRKTGSTDSYFGIRFEIGIAAALLNKKIPLQKTESPDFRIENSSIAIECTGIRSRTIEARKDLTYKIAAALFKKSKNGYENRSTALFIDVTNLAHKTHPFDPQRFREATSKNYDQSPFGSVLLFVSMMNKDLNRFESNYLRVDHPDIDSELGCFWNNQYPTQAHRVMNFSLPYEG